MNKINLTLRKAFVLFLFRGLFITVFRHGFICLTTHEITRLVLTAHISLPAGLTCLSNLSAVGGQASCHKSIRQAPLLNNYTKIKLSQQSIKHQYSK